MTVLENDQVRADGIEQLLWKALVEKEGALALAHLALGRVLGTFSRTTAMLRGCLGSRKKVNSMT